MTFPAQKLINFIDTLDFPVTVYEKRSKTVAWNDVSREFFLSLVAYQKVYALGNRTRPKRFFLEVPSSEIDMDMSIRPPEIELVDLDLAQRISASRKFTFKEKLFVVEGEESVRSGHWVYAHKNIRTRPQIPCVDTP